MNHATQFVLCNSHQTNYVGRRSGSRRLTSFLVMDRFVFSDTQLVAQALISWAMHIAGNYNRNMYFCVAGVCQLETGILKLYCNMDALFNASIILTHIFSCASIVERWNHDRYAEDLVTKYEWNVSFHPAFMGWCTTATFTDFYWLSVCIRLVYLLALCKRLVCLPADQ